MGTKESTSDLGSQVLQNSCKIDRCTGSHTFRVLPCLQKPRNPPHRKLKTRLLRPGDCLWSLCLSPPSSTCSCSCRWTHLSLSEKSKKKASPTLTHTTENSVYSPENLCHTTSKEFRDQKTQRDLTSPCSLEQKATLFQQIALYRGHEKKTKPRNNESFAANPTKRKRKTNHHGRSSDRRSENRPQPPPRKKEKNPTEKNAKIENFKKGKPAASFYLVSAPSKP